MEITLMQVSHQEIQTIRANLKEDWKELWDSKINDNRKGESISRKYYPNLYIEKGEVILASRDFKPVSLQNILEKRLGRETMQSVYPDPVTGGWKKFTKTYIQKRNSKKRTRPEVQRDIYQHQRKGGNGWLNKNRINRKKTIP
jgi:hypothetical protein